MSQFTQKYALVQFFEPIDVSYEYSSSNWPLHSTIVDTFAIDWSVDEMVAQLTKLLSKHSVVNSQAEDDAYFGENGKTRVVLLQRTKSLVQLHLDILTVLEGGSIVLNDPQFARDGFLPHATIQKHAHLHKGDLVKVTSLSIVDMFPGADPYKRKVLETISMGGMKEPRIEKLGISADGEPVFLDWLRTNVEYHLLETPDLVNLVKEVVPTISILGEQQVVAERDLGRIVGTTNLVETTDNDEIIYAKRIGRDAYSRFARNRKPTPCSSIVVVLRKGALGYYLWTAMCAKLLPKDAWIEGSQFSRTHAMAFDESLVQLDTITETRPSA